MKTRTLTALVFLGLATASLAELRLPNIISGKTERPSVLFINVDDLNDWNEVLKGHPQAITPNLQRLAAKGITFSNAICASPVCFPSRTALFSGIRPARSGCISNFNWLNSWRTYVPRATTLPKHLSRHGWKTIGIGKNFHNRDAAEFDEYTPRPREPKAIPNRQRLQPQARRRGTCKGHGPSLHRVRHLCR